MDANNRNLQMENHTSFILLQTSRNDLTQRNITTIHTVKIGIWY
jgi:hypothetical protein